ncbi:amidohydrolase family protein [Aquabacterium sp. A3]|uniref:amidohydrolase family protein n=1 Tax=Aquabacterium sp. A3 TaxID=3132829 RepID=UPI00311A89DD
MSQAHGVGSITRRNSLRLLLGGGMGAVGALGGVRSAAAATGNSRIDVHAHFIPDFFRDALRAYGVQGDGGIPLPSWSIQEAVSFMDKFRIAAQVVSLSEPGLGFLPDLDSRVYMARQLNDYVRQALLGAPAYSEAHRRFGAFAVLPLSNATDEREVEAACQEAHRAVTVLGLDGVGLYSNHGGTYLGDPLLAPLMRTLNDLGAFVFVHPVAPPTRPEVDIPNFVLEFPFETTRAATNMLYKGIFWRYPRIRWMLAHAGGAIPFLSYRAGLLALHLDARNSAFSRLYFDTALSAAPPAMAAARKVTDTGHILFGSDFPYSKLVYSLKWPGDPNAELNDTFSSSERAMVDRANALAQMPRLKARLA